MPCRHDSHSDDPFGSRGLLLRHETTHLLGLAHTAQFIYDNKDVVVGGVGSDYAELIAKCSPDERWYAFVRIETGDELSKR
jgi:hypothetical protein